MGRKEKDRHVEPREVFHLPRDLRDAMLAFIASKRPAPNKSAVLRLALEEFLEREGFWPPKK